MSNKSNEPLLDEIAEYYSNKIKQHGETPQGVDWNGEASQTTRFEQLCKIITNSNTEHFTLNDQGCGYGALFDFMKERYANFAYCGVDISEQMIQAASARNSSTQNAAFITASVPDTTRDFSVASGIFNVRMERSDSEWLDYLHATLDTLHAKSDRGFAFNCLTSYSDEDKKRDYLYYANPGQLFDLCKRRYSKQVALLHDYGLYEFTILVRKNG